MTDPAVRTPIQICIDCADDERLSAFWAVTLGYVEHGVPGGWRELIDPTGRGPVVWFQPVPEGKVVKNRLHLDVWFADEPGATGRRDELIALGATGVRREPDFWLMQDPEGNEFCLCWPAVAADANSPAP